MLLGTSLLAACSTSDNMPDGAAPLARPYVSAHRGGAAYAPENTMLAYRNAARLGVDDFETDTWQTADGVFVLLHDQTLTRTTDCSGTVTAMTHAELQACDAGYWFSPGQGTTSPDDAAAHPARGQGLTIPTAAELFAYAASLTGAYRPTVTIEIKDVLNAARDAAALVTLVQASGIKDRIIIQSFSAFALNRVKALDPAIRTLYLSSGVPNPGLALDRAIADGDDFVAPSYSERGVDAAYVERAHAAGKGVVPWTADRAADLQALRAMGVDGLISNFPGCLLQLQSRLKARRMLPEELGGADSAVCRS
ncbi:glycerophosphodiester phosphodiesterase [Solimonas soli]|uniref:glycerophosphodiester phosphodiesterase n=1 Tax=Solimonas soli TaxID=413479 RepID=UPI0005BC6134|nr:glycerophosphodiester phosphodiesterase family protein [Solimonas soli]